jgi:hypothetical protein
MATLYVKKTREELIAICKERKIKGYSRLKKDEIIKLLSVPTSNEESSSQIYSPSEKIEEFDIIFDVLNNKQVQKELVYLYASTQTEFTRNGKISQEVGRAREDDLKAVLQLHIGDKFNCNTAHNMDNGGDCSFNNPISIKHIGNAIGKGYIKSKWTSDKAKAQDYIKQMLLLDKKNYTHTLLIYIDVKKKHTIQIIAISQAQIMEAVKILKETAFKTAFGTNTRGVEYSKEMIQILINKKYFQIDISNVVLTGGLDPIKRRQLLLESVRPTLM